MEQCFHLIAHKRVSVMYAELRSRHADGGKAQARVGLVEKWQCQTNGGRFAPRPPSACGAGLYDLSFTNIVQFHEGELTLTLCIPCT